MNRSIQIVPILLAALAVACGADRILSRYGARVEYRATEGPALTPEVAEKAAAALPTCPFRNEVAPQTWQTKRPDLLSASVRIPETLGAIEVTGDQNHELWVGEDGSLLSFWVSDGRGDYVLGIDSHQPPIDEIACSAHLAGRLARWHLVNWPIQRDTVYAATARAVLGAGLVLDLGALAPTREGRTGLLQTLLSLELGTRR